MTIGDRQEVVARHADALWQAASTGTPIPPLTATDPELTVEEAYAVQRANVERALAEGARIAGHKVGLTSKAMQEMLGVDEPDFGVLLEDMVLADGAMVPAGRLLQTRVESEIGFRLGGDLSGPGVTTDAALGAIDAAAPALEIIDSRVADWKITLPDTIADNGSSGLAVFGGTWTPVDAVDLPAVEVVLTRNGEPVEQGVGAAALGHPAACVAWLANKLAEFGEHLPAGMLILPGAVHRAVTVAPGDVFHADFTGLGSVTVHFAAEEVSR
jgi:2-keto-4-pentenoate hydratase